jgi:hydrogenase/urease accessory protein HupE
MIMKKLLLNMAFVAVAFTGVASAAQAAVVPVCEQVWVQVTPFSGYYTTVCENVYF